MHRSFEDIFEVPYASKFRAFRSSLCFEVPCGHLSVRVRVRVRIDGKKVVTETELLSYNIIETSNPRSCHALIEHVEQCGSKRPLTT